MTPLKNAHSNRVSDKTYGSVLVKYMLSVIPALDNFYISNYSYQVKAMLKLSKTC